MKRLDDEDERRRAAETLRLAADAIEAGHGESFDVRVEPYLHEAFVGRFVAQRRTDAKRVTIHVTFVADASMIRGRSSRR